MVFWGGKYYYVSEMCTSRWVRFDKDKGAAPCRATPVLAANILFA
jgi:hypothetical protein